MQRAARGSPLYRECPPALLCVNSRGKREPWVTDRAQAGAWWELSEHRGGFCLSPSHSSPSLSPSTSLLPSFISFFFKFSFSFFFIFLLPSLKQSPGVESGSQPRDCLLLGSPVCLLAGAHLRVHRHPGASAYPQKCPPASWGALCTTSHSHTVPVGGSPWGRGWEP